MANILGGIAVSHTPTIGFAVDHHKQQDPGGRRSSRASNRCSAGWRRKTGCAGVHL
nr:hypothetical protein [Klebsiella pneumoniae subsp. pneumoniae]